VNCRIPPWRIRAGANREAVHVQVAQVLLALSCHDRDDAIFPPGTAMRRHIGLACCIPLVLGCAQQTNNSGIFSAIRFADEAQASRLLKANPGLLRQAEEMSGDYPIHVAVAEDQLAIVTMMCNYGADVNMPNRHSFQPLHVAASNGNLRITRFLIGQKADLDGKTATRRSPLHIAAEGKHVQVVQLLMEKGAKSAWNDTFSMQPIDYAALNADTKLLSAMIAGGANRTPLCNVAMGNIGDLTMDLASDPQIIDSKFKSSHTLLHVAARNGKPEVTRLLLQRGADPDPKSDDGTLPLHYACEAGDLETTKMLAKRGNVNLLAANEMTPLFYAARTGNADLCEHLLSLGANPNVRNGLGATPLTIAVESASLPVCKALLRRGADVNLPSAVVLVTPLHIAIERGYDDLCRVLVEAGARLDLENAQGKTPLDVASPRMKEKLQKMR